MPPQLKICIQLWTPQNLSCSRPLALVDSNNCGQKTVFSISGWKWENTVVFYLWFVESADAKPGDKGPAVVTGKKSMYKSIHALPTCVVQESTVFPSLFWDATGLHYLRGRLHHRGFQTWFHRAQNSTEGPVGCGDQHEAVMVTELSFFSVLYERTLAKIHF